MYRVNPYLSFKDNARQANLVMHSMLSHDVSDPSLRPP